MPTVEPDPIDALPTTPLRSMAAAAFRTAAHAYLSAFPAMRSQFNAAAEATYTNAVIAEEAAATNLNAAALTATSVTPITIGENTSKGPFTFAESGREFNKAHVVNIVSAADPTVGMFGCSITAVDNTAKTMTVFVPADGSEGSGSISDWIITASNKRGAPGNIGAQQVAVSAQSGAWTAAPADLGKLIEYTGTGGDTWAADIGVVGADFAFAVRHGGTGVLILDFSQDIDGKGAVWVYPGESFSLTSSATAWKTIGRARRWLASEVATASQAAAAFEAVFSDPELPSGALEFRLVGLVGPAGSQSLAAQLKYNGAYVTSSNYGYTAGGGGTGSTGFLSTAANPFRVSGVVTMPNPLANAAGTNPVIANLSGADPASNFALDNAQTGACQGIRFQPGSGSFASGSGAIRCYIIRE